MRLSQLVTLASCVSWLRVALAAALPLLPRSLWLPVYLAALATDVLDGAVARRTGTASAAGATLDAWADKALAVNTGWTLVNAGVVPAWWMLPWFIREILQVPLVFVFAHRWRVGVGRPATRPLGRVTTIFLAFTLVLALAGVPSVHLTLVVGALGLAAGMDYARLHFSHLRTVPLP